MNKFIIFPRRKEVAVRHSAEMASGPNLIFVEANKFFVSEEQLLSYPASWLRRVEWGRQRRELGARYSYV